MCRVGRNGRKSSEKRFVLSARIAFGYCRRKSANPGSPGKETTTHYDHASWQGGFFSCTVSFFYPLAPATWQTVRAHCDPEEGKELDLAMEHRVLFGPPGPLQRLQRHAEEGNRTFGPEFWPLVLQEIWKIQPRPCEDSTTHLAGGQRPSGFVGREEADVSAVNVGTMHDYADQNPLLLPFVVVCAQVAPVAHEASVVFSSVARYTG